jgi:hypothetical protein
VGTYTSRGNLYKSAADGSESVNVVADLSNNMDRLDALLGWRPVTSGTVPASAFQGAPFFRTDTGKFYINTGVGGSAALTLVQVLAAGATFDSGVTIAGSGFYSGEIRSTQATGAGRAFVARLTADVDDRFRVDQDGPVSWGDGTNPTDVSVFRTGAGALATDGSFQVGSDLIVGGDVSAANVAVDDDLEVNGAVLRPQLHAPTTVANTTAESVLQLVNVPADDAVIGSTYRIRVFGTAAVTGTPTITFRLRLGGVTGTAVLPIALGVTARSGMTDGYWEMDAILTCTSSPGAGATWSGTARFTHNFVSSVTTYTSVGPVVLASASVPSNVSQDYVLTVTWSAASASNTVTARGGESGRVA